MTYSILLDQKSSFDSKTIETTTLRVQQAREMWEVIEDFGDADGHICQIVKRSMAVAS